MPANQVSNVYSANVTHIFSPTLTNEFVFADATFLNPIALSNPAAVDPAKVGFSISPLFADQYTPQIPNSLSWTGALPGYFAPTFGQSFEGGDFGKLSQTPNYPYVEVRLLLGLCAELAGQQQLHGRQPGSLGI
jgi:hypothetical protein